MPFEAPQQPAARPAPDLSGRIQSIDGLRALAMLLVFTFHVWEFSGRPALPISLLGGSIDLAAFISENTRVALFIVLSGFCLFLPFCKRPSSMEHLDVPRYYWHRFCRIAPPYYAALLYPIVLPLVLVAAFKMFGLAADWQTAPTAWQYLTHFLFLHTFFVETWRSVNGSLWTLGLEAQFYLVFPFLIWGFQRWGMRLIGGLVLGSILYRMGIAAVIPAQPWEVRFLWDVFFAGQMMQFAFGMGAAWLVFRWREHRPHLNAWGGTLLVVAAIALYQFALIPLPAAMNFFPWRSTLLGLAFAVAIVAFAISVTPLRWLVENPVMSRLGLISYSLFLIHQPTAWYVSEGLEKIFHTSGRTHFFLLCTVGFAMTLLIGGLFYRFIERPFNGSSKRKKIVAVNGPLSPFPVPAGSRQLVPEL